MGYSLFQTSTLGMKSQAHALSVIGTNIANINTGGFKGTDTRFATMLSSNLRTGPGDSATVNFASQDRALGGVRPKDVQRIDEQGRLSPTQRDLDLAIVGDGFFEVSPKLAVSNDVLFTRDGSFQINVAGAPFTRNDSLGSPIVDGAGAPIQFREGYLTDKNGFFLLGFAPQVDGTFPTTGTLQPLRVDEFAFTNSFRATTTASLNLNLPAKKQFGEANESFNINLIDSLGVKRSVTMSFARTPTDNQWRPLLSGDNLTTSTFTQGAAFSLATGTTEVLDLNVGSNQISARIASNTAVNKAAAFQGLKVGDSITLAGSGAGNNGTFTIGAISSDGATVTLNTATPLPGTSEVITTAATITSTRSVATPMVFDGKGQLTTPTTYNIGLTWANGATNTFALDISNMTQFAGDFSPVSFDQNGLSASNLKDITFDSLGHVVGSFEDGTARNIYKIPLAMFANPNGLEARSGTVFAETGDSGPPRVVPVDISGAAQFAPSTLELSNVNLALQFTTMIQTQNAYNSSATVFKTVDEMTTVARDLKA